MDRLVGTALGRYWIEALEGRGGMASVYRATDPAFGRPVAIKVLAAALARDPGFAERFLREARAVARLQHPHILPVHDVGEQDGTVFLVMPYIDGGTFRDRLLGAEGARPLPVGEAAALLRPVAAALDYAHRQGIIHRDVKPNNILLTAQQYPLLADFGIAKTLAQGTVPAITATGMMLGTPEYMSPEQGQGGPIDGRSDLYALGVVLYETLTGRPPFRAETPADTPVAIVVRQVMAQPPAPRSLNPALSPAVEAVLLRALAKRPDDRYPTGAALFDALDEAAVDPEDLPTAFIRRGVVPKPALRPTPPATAPPGEHVRAATPGAAAVPAAAAPEPPPARGAFNGRLLGVALLVLLLLGAGLLGAFALAGGGGGATAPAESLAIVDTPAGDDEEPDEDYVDAAAGPPAEPTATATLPAAATASAPAIVATATAPAGSTAAAGPASRPSPTALAVARTERREVILFSSHRGADHDSQIYVMDPDGGRQRQLTSSRGHSWGPRIAPDGKTFVFSSVAPGEHSSHAATGGGLAGSGNHDIYLANGDGANIVKLTRELSWDNAWSWSPDGRWIIFASDRDGNWELYKMTIAGEQVTRLTNHPAQDGWPSWTPDGKSIVFASDRDGYSQIYSMDADGANVRRLHYSESYDTLPVVSPDGTRIVYSAQLPGGNEGEIYTMALDGSRTTRLTSTIALNSEPSWSPDGTKIVFVSDRDGNSNIYVMNADGTGQVRLTNDPGEDVTPSWGYLQTAVLSRVDPGRAPATGAAHETLAVWRHSRARRRAEPPTGARAAATTRGVSGG